MNFRILDAFAFLESCLKVSDFWSFVLLSQSPGIFSGFFIGVMMGKEPGTKG
jgi:hypothetical protein